VYIMVVLVVDRITSGTDLPRERRGSRFSPRVCLSEDPARKMKHIRKQLVMPHCTSSCLLKAPTQKVSIKLYSDEAQGSKVGWKKKNYWLYRLFGPSKEVGTFAYPLL
jgi:hypothetical protein